MLSGHNANWMWGAGRASDRTVLVVDALGQLKPYFASCRQLTTYYAPYGVQNDTGSALAVVARHDLKACGVKLPRQMGG